MRKRERENKEFINIELNKKKITSCLGANARDIASLLERKIKPVGIPIKYQS